MAKKDALGSWLNSNGNYIPANKIPKIYKQRDATVMRIIARMEKLEAIMKKVKAQNFADVEKYLTRLARNSKTDMKDIAGNITLSSYDNLNKVELNRNQIEGFDEQLNAAKTIIDSCIIKWSKGSNVNLIPVITEAFRLDNNKRFNTNAIWSLTKLQIKDAQWERAMELVKSSRQKLGSKQYMSISKRKNHNQLFKSVNMNFSSIELEEEK